MSQPPVGPGRALARFKDLCIDAQDVASIARFWSDALGLDVAGDVAGDVVGDGSLRLVGPTPQHTVWVNRVSEAKSVKNRMHLDIHGARGESEALLIAAGQGVLQRLPHWTVLADPEGGEFCLFERTEPPVYRLYEVVLDAADPLAVATWWAGVLGTSVQAEGGPDADGPDAPDVGGTDGSDASDAGGSGGRDGPDASDVGGTDGSDDPAASDAGGSGGRDNPDAPDADGSDDPAATSSDEPWYSLTVPGAPFESLVVESVPEPKLAKNRVHIDVTTSDLPALLRAGATVLRAPGASTPWYVLADPEGNEFCAFEAIAAP